MVCGSRIAPSGVTLMDVVVRPEARLELLEAQRWYEAISPGLGSEFCRAVDAAVARAARNPLAFACLEDPFRHVITRKFPYSIIYAVLGPRLVVVSCFHQKRKPGSWKRRSTDPGPPPAHEKPHSRLPPRPG